jgi:Lrp/AsnC family leucine-responsive transcriptional regulator
MNFDDTDRQILSYLLENARIPISTIAREIGMATSAVGERVRKLEERGIIQGYETRIDANAIGQGLTAYIYVRTDEGVASDATASQLMDIPEVQEVHNIAGEDCYLVKVRIKDTPALSRFLRDALGHIETVTNTRTTIVLETYKESLAFPLNSQRPRKKSKSAVR